jgi:hypothetical protein
MYFLTFDLKFYKKVRGINAIVSLLMFIMHAEMHNFFAMIIAGWSSDIPSANAAH